MSGFDDVSAVVSFHGGLSTLTTTPEDIATKVLVLSGGEDDASSAIMDLEMTFDGAGATWEITRYSDILHAFTVWSDGKHVCDTSRFSSLWFTILSISSLTAIFFYLKIATTHGLICARGLRPATSSWKPLVFNLLQAPSLTETLRNRLITLTPWMGLI